MKTSSNTFVKILLAVIFCVIPIFAKGQVPYQFVYNGTVYGNTPTFPNWTAAQNCPSAHKDPSGNNYVHCHPSYDFGGLIVNIGGVNVTVTAAMSDAAWALVYAGYTKVSGSTFAINCYAYADGAPKPTDDSAWTQFTTPYNLCSGSSKTTSTLVNGNSHCVAFTESGTEECYVVTTSEKNASGPVYTLTVNQDFYIVTGASGRWAYAFDPSEPIGQNR